jgi:hypothetical protein
MAFRGRHHSSCRRLNSTGAQRPSRLGKGRACGQHVVDQHHD